MLKQVLIILAVSIAAQILVNKVQFLDDLVNG